MTNESIKKLEQIIKTYLPNDFDIDAVIQALKEPQPTKPRPITSEGAYVLDVESGQVMTAGEYQRRQSKAQGDEKTCFNCIYKDRGAFEEPCEVCTRNIGFRDKWKGVADE